MENCYWPEDYGSRNCGQNHELHKHDDSLMVPWLSTGEAAAALQYHCYHPPVAEDRTASASRSHSEAEKRRRDRINAQLSTLRKLIPKSEKMDKAALLGQVVDHVKEQSRRAKEVSKLSTIPTETDEVIIDHLGAEETTSQKSICMKASICCEDRPELFSELKGTIKGLGLAILQAEITSLGGRTKINFVLCAEVGRSKQNCPVKQSLELALSRIVMSSGATTYSARSKRQRFFYPNSH